MNVRKLLTVLITIIPFNLLGQNQKVIDFKITNWDINPTLFYISEVVDERIEKANAGQALSGSKSIPVVFKNSLETDIKNLISASVNQDTSTIPLILCFDKFQLKDKGATIKHTISLDFSLTFYRVINTKRYKIIQIKGRPEMKFHGSSPNPYELVIQEALISALKNFNDWINQNDNLPQMAATVKVIFELPNTSDQNGDTIFWNEKYKLRWDDFKGTAIASSYMAQSYCAFTYHALPIVKKGVMELHIDLNANFSRKFSWVQPGQKKDTLLQHEQLHFDICELNIRKIRNRIIDYLLTPMEFDEQIKTLFKDGWNEYQIQQELYDKETLHGIVKDKQQLWQKNISDLLKNTPIIETFSK